MPSLLAAILTLVCALSATAQETPFSKVVKASLVFHEDRDATRPYPHTLIVFLRLDNANDSGVSWVADPIFGVKAELLDAANKPVPHPPSLSSGLSNPSAYFLPFGSRLDWLISFGGISMMGNAKDSYALMIGDQGWFIPIRTARSYTLHVRLYGTLWARSTERTGLQAPELLIDLAPAKVEVTP